MTFDARAHVVAWLRERGIEVGESPAPIATNVATEPRPRGPDPALLSALEEVLLAAARPVLAKERMAVERAVKRLERDPKALVEWIRAFYAELVAYAVQALQAPTRALAVLLEAGPNAEVDGRLEAALKAWGEACVARAFAQQRVGALVRLLVDHEDEHARRLVDVAASAAGRPGR